MINPTEQDEREYLEEVKEKLQLAVARIDRSVREYAEDLRRNKQYIYENQSGMDEADMVAAERSINRIAYTGESAVSRKAKLIRLIASPYFGRIDFRPDGATNETPVYIGISSFSDDSRTYNLIYDWRAPIASVFYDYELGEAGYETPSGRITGALLLKRQYRIRDGRMEFMIENTLNIQDDVLQKELSKASDEKMKQIVATIQRDQNAIIRNDTSPVLIIQGVAGSGKTSIALHRIAFLLYRFRDEIAAKDILIISPNRVFADYISSVLPELGEENIPETGMEELAADLLENKYRFQNFFQQVTHVLERHDADFIERIRFKSSFDFLRKLNQYLIHVENNYFTFAELAVGKVIVPFPFILERFRAYHRIPLLKRFGEVVRDVQHYVRDIVKRKLTGAEKARIWQAIPAMFRFGNILDLYRDFFVWIKRPDLFRMTQDGQLEYADVFPLIYFRIRLEGVTPYDHVKHLLIDEMQDYTPVQYSVLSRLFKCRKTILGDVSQTVNPYSASSSDTINQVFPQADVVKLTRSYRSTLEITSFAQQIINNPELIAMERHGPSPEVMRFNSTSEEARAVRRIAEDFKKSGYRSLAIICKTYSQARMLYREINMPQIVLLSYDSSSFRGGLVMATVHLSKGLEFDQVVVPYVTAKNYRTEADKNMLYIACTRAMHELVLTHTGERSALLPHFS